VAEREEERARKEETEKEIAALKALVQSLKNELAATKKVPGPSGSAEVSTTPTPETAQPSIPEPQKRK